MTIVAALLGIPVGYVLTGWVMASAVPANLTIPTVLVIGMLTDHPIVLAESPINLALLAITLLVSVIGFSAKKVTAVQGAAHLIIFVVFGLALFA